MRSRHSKLAWLVLGLSIGGGVVAGAESTEGILELPEPKHQGDVSVERALARRRSVRDFAPTSLPLAAISQLLWAAQGVSHPGGLRTAPSAGALYPLELYLVAGAVLDASPGLYRYDADEHQLRPESRGDLRAALAKAALEQYWMAEAPAILVLAAVYERTAQKYGDRAPRYVHMEVGHAAQNVYLQALAIDLGTTLVGAFRDRQVARVLGLPHGTEPLALLPVGRPRRP